MLMKRYFFLICVDTPLIFHVLTDRYYVKLYSNVFRWFNIRAYALEICQSSNKPSINRCRVLEAYTMQGTISLPICYHDSRSVWILINSHQIPRKSLPQNVAYDITAIMSMYVQRLLLYWWNLNKKARNVHLIGVVIEHIWDIGPKHTLILVCKSLQIYICRRRILYTLSQ